MAIRPTIDASTFRAGPAAALCIGLAALAPAAGAQSPQGYRIGEAHPARQVNLCDDRAEARELAGIFRKYGVRPGFSALSNAPACARRVAAVTPLRVLDSVAVAPDTEQAYDVSFVLVLVDGGEQVLVTTRPVGP